MIRSAWRIVKRRYASRAFDGEGARRWGGRWSSQGRRVVYLASSISLAMLEMLVHSDRCLLPHYVVFPVRFDDGLVERLDPGTLPEGWREMAPPSALQRLGDDWLDRGTSAMLEVPSAIVPSEPNLLLDPAHADRDRVEIGDPMDLATDPRLRAGR